MIFSYTVRISKGGGSVAKYSTDAAVICTKVYKLSILEVLNQMFRSLWLRGGLRVVFDAIDNKTLLHLRRSLGLIHVGIMDKRTRSLAIPLLTARL